jgi:hypothetical protein
MSIQEYIIYKDIFVFDPYLLEDFKNQLQDAGPIFNSKRNDNKRCQCNLKITKQNKNFMDTMNQFVKKLDNNLIPSKWVLIKSKPGCKPQLAHMDYENTQEFQTCISNNKQVPLLVLVALQPNTYIYLWENSSKVIQGTYKGAPIEPTKIELKEGDVLVFRADAIHAGSDYEEENIRMHCYLDSQEVDRDENRTFIISKHGNEYMNNHIIQV